MIDLYLMMRVFLLDLKPLQQPFYLLKRYLSYLSRSAGPLESHTIQKLFGGQDKTIFIISEHFDGIPSFITKDKNIRALIWIELELHTDQGSQTLYLFAEIRSSTLPAYSGNVDYTHDFFILIFSDNSHFSLSELQKDEDNIFILIHRFEPILFHHQATMASRLLTCFRIPLLCASFPLKEPHKYEWSPLRNGQVSWR